MSKSITGTERTDMQYALWLARNVMNVCTSQPRCQAATSTKETVDGWVRRVEATFNQHSVFRGSWEANVLIQAMDAYDRWRLEPADSTFDYTMNQLPTPAKADPERGKAEDSLAAVRKELAEVRVALSAHQRAYEATKQAIYLASQTASMAQGELCRVLPDKYTKPAEPCGLTGEEQ